MFYFTGTYTKSQGSECPMSGGMAITTNNRTTGKCQSQFWTDYMNYPLILIMNIKKSYSEFFTIIFQCFYL